MRPPGKREERAYPIGIIGLAVVRFKKTAE